MLYRPKFCANCGETIERVEWGLLTSRRFCAVCESQYKGQDLIPRVIVVIGMVSGIFGLGAYLRSGRSPDLGLVRPAAGRGAEQGGTAAALKAGSVQPELQRSPIAKASETPAVNGPPPRPVGQPTARLEVAESQYYCGAETKKGTPCMRRVKGNIRCYQHTGMPAMTTADKLKIN